MASGARENFIDVMSAAEISPQSLLAPRNLAYFRADPDAALKPSCEWPRPADPSH